MTYTAPERGYIQVFVANVSDQEVFFDQMEVEHIPQLIVQENHYYPFGLELAGLSKKGKPNNKYQYNGKERQSEFGLNWLDYGARNYDIALGRFNRIDRFAEKYYDLNPYQYGANDPIKTIDINGDSTFVAANKNGTYTVVGGNLDGNHNGIFIRNADGSIGKLIGYSATPQSFYYEEGKRWAGTINPNDKSGKTFLNNFLENTPNLLKYMPLATGNQPYDFKRLGQQEGVDEVDHMYRGMPIMGEHKGKKVFASARDVGNVGAGLVAALNGLPWRLARLGFDVLQSWQDHKLSKESMSTRYAEKLGHAIGSGIRNKMFYSKSRLPGNEHLRHVKVFKRPITQSDYRGSLLDVAKRAYHRDRIREIKNRLGID